MLKFNVTIKGVAPLLFNRFPDEEKLEGQSRAKKAVEAKEAQAEKSLYRDENNAIYTPADHIIGAMIKAGVVFKLEGKKTYKDVMKGGIFINPLKIVHQTQKFDIDRRPVVIQRARIMKARARMDEWSLKFELVCIDDRATAKDIQDILEYAGTYVGIGDYRPRYGRFEVVEFVRT